MAGVRHRRRGRRLIVAAAVGWCVLRYRDRGQPIPKQTHGRPALEIGLTILPAVILIGVAIPTVGTLMALSKTTTPSATSTSPASSGGGRSTTRCRRAAAASTTPIVTSGQMVIPIGTKVLVRGTSRDVIHSFWIPRLNGKRDMVPGRVQTLRMEADQPGIYAGQCTEFCGLSHANMRMEVVALDAGGLRDVEGRPAGAVRRRRRRTRWPPRASRRSSPSARAATRSTGSRTPTATRSSPSPELYVYSEAAPNLTHLMTRNTFAGATFDLLIQECRDRVWNAPPEEFGAALPRGRHARLPEPGRPARVAAQRAGEEADVHRPRQSSARRTARLVACRTSPCPRTRSTSSSPTSWNGTEPWPSSNAPSRRRRRRPAGRVGHAVDVARRLPPPRLDHRLAVVAVHGRPQEARHHVRRQRDGVLRRRRHRGAARSGPSSPAPTARCSRRRPLQPDVHHARHVDGVPLRHADGGGVRQLLPAAAGRRP